MRFIRSIFAIVLFIASFVVPVKSAQLPFSDTLSKATLAVYSGKQVCQYKSVDTFFGPHRTWGCEFKARFTCTATVIDKDGNGNFVGLTAGHCFSYELMDKGEKYYVSASLDEKPVLNEIRLVKFVSDDRYDYAVFEFHSLRDYPVIAFLSDKEVIPAIETKVVNVNFSLGVVKQIAEGKVVSKQIMSNEGGRACDRACGGRYFVSIGIGPGASGSAVVDVKTHKIIGIVEAIFPSTQMATIVAPMGSRFVDFMDDASAGIRPQVKPKPRVPTFSEWFSQFVARVVSNIRKFWS